MGFGKSRGRSAPAAPRAPPPARAAPAAARPGMMGMMGSSMVGSMAGSMIGNTLFGGGGGAPAPAEVAAPAPAGYAPAPAGPTCAMESRHFLECMSQVNDDMNYCRQYYDSFTCAARNRRCSKRAAPTAAWSTW